ncbi:uncharacterized protein LOC113305960 [Papaver somniferum]|uniref:uncharacterized protein LOC113305960 n=1 Tax=Papaver somniferum TaxID=3469 RepID=UPI000E6F56BC|nr:uncharacterized protein LOC113305960 [Papaver somniferum]
MMQPTNKSEHPQDRRYYYKVQTRVNYNEGENWVSVNYNVTPWRICQVCKVLDHRVEPCVEGEVVLVSESPSVNEDGAEFWMDVGHVGHSGRVDMSNHGVSKATITALQLEEARDSIVGIDEEVPVVVHGESGVVLPPTVGLSSADMGMNSGELTLIASQMVLDTTRRFEDKKMADERNRIKGKAKVVVDPVSEIISYNLKDEHSNGNLVICEGGNKEDLEEAIKCLYEAKEYQLKARNLSDFSANIVEPERKRRKVLVVDVIAKKSKVDQNSMLPEDDPNIIVANSQMISILVRHHDDPFDMFNEYVNHFHASPCMNQAAGISDEMILSAHDDQIIKESSEELGASVHSMV